MEELKEKDILVTIEYCTNCKEHEGTTRHDENKYYNTAVELKKEILRHFPVIKIFLKPLIVDTLDKNVDSVYVRRRIGCFEVQIVSNSGGDKSKKGILFSKL